MVKLVARVSIMQKKGFAPCLRMLLLKENARVCQFVHLQQYQK